MKKIMLSTILILLCIIFAGCSASSESQALHSLNTQLDRVTEIVSSTNSSEVSEVSFFSTNSNNLQIPKQKEEAYQNMVNEEDLRKDVLTLANYLKSNQSVKYNLGNNKVNALNDLTSSLSKYVTYLNNTKNDVKNSVNKIKKFTKVQTFNAEQTKAAYTELANSMNERQIYLTILYNTMCQISEILDNSLLNIDDKLVEQNSNLKEKENNNNIDTYKNKSTENIDYSNNEINNYPNSYMYNNNCYLYNRNYKYNPNRNTDTFYPRVKNIDTYRYKPNTNNYYNNNYNRDFEYENNIPTSNLENIEKIKNENSDFIENKI